MSHPLLKQAMLNAAAWFRANPQGWTSGLLAVTADGDSVPPTDKRAVCFCAVGRIAKELANLDPTLSNKMALNYSMYTTINELDTRPEPKKRRRTLSNMLISFNDYLTNLKLAAGRVANKIEKFAEQMQ